MNNKTNKTNLKNIALRLPCSCNLNCRYCCGKIEDVFLYKKNQNKKVSPLIF